MTFHAQGRGDETRRPAGTAAPFAISGRIGRRRRGIVGASATGPKEDAMSHMLDAAGRRRSPATMPGFHAGRPPRNKGMRYPADPPTVEEIVAVMRTAGDSP